MRRMTILMLVCFAASAAAAAELSRADLASEVQRHLREQYGSVATSPVPSGILYDLVAPLSRIERFDGSAAAETMTAREWIQVAHELRRASLVESPLPSYAELGDAARRLAREHVHLIAILDMRFERVRRDANADQLFSYDGERITAINGRLLESARVVAATALRDWTYRGNRVHFRLDRDFFFSNIELAQPSIEIDFDDGLGYRPVDFGDVTASYRAIGWKTIRVRATQNDGRVLFLSFRFHVRSLDTPTPHETWQLSATLPYQGVYATGEAYVYRSDQNSTLTRPVILVEGLDLDNSMNWDELYVLMNQQELLETLRQIGYDAVVLNYGQGTTYVQANAFLVESLIEQVNAALADSVPTVLVGASMGGLTTRYALTHMEANSVAHRVRTLVSFDSPQRGADIPLGIQYWTDFFADQSADAAAMRDALNTPAARQLLLAHFTSPPSSVPTADPLRQVMMTELAQLGNYPAQPRKVAVANGSGMMQGVGFSPGAQLILYEYRSLLLDITGNVWALNNAASQLIFEGEIDLIWPLPDERMNVTVQPTTPWDNAPGGLTASMAEMDSAQVDYGDVIALHPKHCFIPTISSLDLNVTDPFHNIAGDPDLYSRTPFDSLYFPAVNQDHIEITAESFGWFLREVVGPLPAPVVVILADSAGVRLNWSPVVGARSYRIYSSDDAEIWPGNFVSTSQTVWPITPTADRQFFYVQASLDLP